MPPQSHAALIDLQFGPQAAAYVSSPVHAQGEDLDRLSESVRARRPNKVLDLGSGGGHVSFRVAPHAGMVVAYDLSRRMLDAVASVAIERGLSNIETRQGAAEALPFADGSFDLVVSRYSAHHWRDLDAGLAEARRVLAPAGRAIFMDVIAPAAAVYDTHLQTVELLRDPSHVRDYSLIEWRRALARAGFAPGEAVTRRLRLDFASWTARMRTPDAHVGAIRSLQAGAPDELMRYFAIETDGSFTIDTLSIEATAGGA